MRFLIDSAKIDDVKAAMDLGFVNGVTTNTREVSYHAGDNLGVYLRNLRRVAKGTIHIQVTTEDADSIVAEGRAIHSAIRDVRVKIPVTVEGLKATRTLAKQGVRVAGTAVNTVTMAVLSAIAGAEAVIPYYGVMEDFEADATNLLQDIMDAYRHYEFRTQLVYFARNVKEVRAGLRAGAHGCLMTLAGLKSLTDEPMGKREVDFMICEWRRRFGNRSWACLARK